MPDFNSNSSENNPRNKKFILADLYLWKELSGRKINNFRFLRHEIIEECLVDYYCPELQFIILISPAENGMLQHKNDFIVKTLTAKNFHVRQFDYDIILSNTSQVVNEIKNYAIQISKTV